MRQPRASWVHRLRSTTGISTDDIRWNEAVSRWEFMLGSADGITRSQFWGHFDKEVDPFTGLHPYRDLGELEINEALMNLEKTFVGNRHDGAGSTFRQVEANIRFNRDNSDRYYRNAGEEWADRVIDRGRRLRGSPQVTVTKDIA